MTPSNNRAVTLIGANRIFNPSGIVIKQSPLGFYESEGIIKLQATTLTELCQDITQRFSEAYQVMSAEGRELD